jgi:hypothetical protein
MGITYLNLEPGETPNTIMVHFNAVNRGARNWAACVDAWPEALKELDERLQQTMRFLDEGKSMGSGARVELHTYACAFAVALWQRKPEVAEALTIYELVVRVRGAELLPPRARFRASRRALAHRRMTPPASEIETA